MDIDGVFEEIGELGPYQFKVYICVLTLALWTAYYMIHNVFVGDTPPFMCLGQSEDTCPGGGRPCLNATFSDNFTSIVSEVAAALAILHTWLAYYQVHTVYAGAIPEFTCRDPRGGGRVEGCSASRTCIEPDYSKSTFTSIASEWNLVCSEAYKASLVQSVYMMGVLFGALVFGTMSDRSGRRPSLFIAIIGSTVFGFLSSFATGYIMYCALRFAAGLLCGGAILVSFVLTTEVVGSSKRAMCGMIIPAVFAVGIAMFAYTAYLIPNWRMLSIVSAAPGLLWIMYYWYIPESPRWLLAQGRVTDAENVLVMIANRNLGRTYGKAIRLRPLSLQPDVGKSYGVADIFARPNLRIMTVIQVYAWFVDPRKRISPAMLAKPGLAPFVNCGVYYGLTMSAGALGSNRYISVAMSGMVELPAYFLTFCLLDRVGRRPTFCVAMLIGGASCMSILLTPADATTVITALAMLGKLAISASFATAYVYSAELYPTVIRNNALGICSMAARVGGIVSPMIIPLGSVYPNLQFLVFGGLAFTAGIFSLRLPETMNRPMPETLEDMDGPREVYDTTQLSEDKVKLLEEDISTQEEKLRAEII